MPSTEGPKPRPGGAPSGAVSPPSDRPPNDAVDPLLVEAAPLIEAFTRSGHRLYLVGGIVRDLLAGRVDDLEGDLDFTTDATPPDIKAIVAPVVDALWTQGERFGTIGAKIGDRIYEITTHRAETYRDDSRKPEVRFSQAIAEDLSRRDFTVNAMAIDVADRSLVDPHGGSADLAARILRTPLDPEISFADDPLRMLRAARFAAGYALEPTEAVIAAMEAMADRMAIVSVERIRDELDKLLAVAAAPVGLELLATTSLLSRLLPWTDDDRAGADEFIDRIVRVGTDRTLRLAVLVADPDTGTVRARLRHLRYSTARTSEVVTIVVGAVALVGGAGMDAPRFRRWFTKVGPHADAARSVATALDPAAAAVEASRRLESELADELDDLGPPLTARQIMGELGWRPGPRIGEAIDHLTALRLDHGPLDEAAARTALRSWAASAE